MNHQGPEVEVLLGLGGAFRRVPLASIAAITRIPLLTLRESFSRLFLSFLDRNDECSSSLDGEPTEGSGNVRFVHVSSPSVSSDNVPNVPENPIEKETLTFTDVPSDAPAHESVRAVGSVATAASGEFLALLLDDEASRPFYDQLVMTTPRELIARALDLTLARRSTIHGRPGAYFTAIVRRLTEPHAYARTPPSTP